MNKFEQIFKNLNIQAWEIPETIANIIILKHFLKDEYPFLNFFQDNNNFESKKYIRNLILSYPKFFDNENIANGLHQLGNQFAGKMNNYKDIKILVQEISKFDEKELKDFYNYFLEILEKNSYKTGYIPSPKEINILAKNILDPKEGTFYSPVFGVGKNFIDISKSNIKSFNGQEYSYQNFLLAKIYLEINNLKGSIKLDSFENDQFEGETFDYSFSIPPFGLKYENIKGNTDFYFINKVLNHLNEKGKGVIVSPFLSVFNIISKTKEKGQEIIKSGFLESIILLPKGSFFPYSGVQTVLWVFDKNKKDKKIFFIDGMDSNIQEISDIFINKNEGRISKFGTIKQIEEKEFNLNPILYVYSEEKVLQIKANSYIMKLTLSDIPKYIRDKFTIKGRGFVNKESEKRKFEELNKYSKNTKKYKEIKNEIKNLFMFFVVSESLKYNLDKNKLIDLVEEGAKGLELAIGKFKLEDDIKFMSFARYYIKGFIDISIGETDKDKLEKEISKEKIDTFEEENNNIIENINESLENKEYKPGSNYDNLIQESDKLRTNEKLIDENLIHIKEFNKKIHTEIIDFSNNFELYPLDSKDEIWENWNTRMKDSMRLANIISLNSYIYNYSNNQEQINSQLELINYFDKHLENELKLKTRKKYANKLLIILIIETCLLFIIVGILFYKLQIKELSQISDLLKWMFGLTLGQMTLMVGAIVKYLFPNGEKNDGK